MQKRKIGSLEVSMVGLGCNNFGWRIGPDDTKAVLAASLEAGVNFLDTADMYGTGQSEEYLGNALGKRRKEVVLCTKFGFEMGEGKAGASPKYVREAAEASLRRLKTDYIDLYLVHRPDPETPIADTLGALNELASEGMVREIGCSNFSAAQLAEAAAATPPGARGFVTIQNEYSLVKRTAEEDVIPECKRLGISFIPYFPLANGLLSGKYRLGKSFPENSRGKDEWGPKVFDPEYLNIVEKLAAFAEQRGRTLLELAISWLACQETVPSVIAGARTPEQARANAAAGSWKLSPQEMAEVDAITVQHVTVSRSV